MTTPASYFAMIPHMADDDLDPFEYRLYGHYTRVCGQEGGRCFQSVKDIHEKTCMSPTAITKARNSLQSKGYINVVIPDGRARRKGENISVTLIDRWQENVERYQKLIPFSNTKELNQSIDSITVPAQEELNKEELLKEEKTTTTPPVVQPIPIVKQSVVVSSGDEQLAITVFKPAAQSVVTEAEVDALVLKAQPRDNGHQNASPPNSAPPPSPEQQLVQEAYEKRWKLLLVGNEATRLFDLLKARGVGYVLARIDSTNTHDDSGKPIKKPMRYMATVPEKPQKFVARSHRQNDNRQSDIEASDDRPFTSPPPKTANTPKGVLAWQSR
jgi:DNA-binding MarR family transcriptional regulator